MPSLSGKLLSVAFLVLAGCGASPGAQPDDANAAASTTAAAESPSASAAPTSIPIPTAGSPGDWTKPNPKGKAVGEACSKPDDCQSGVCEGEGCTTGPKCVDANRNCTRDLVSFCGCDGKTFASSGSCPGRPFSKRGSCSP